MIDGIKKQMAANPPKQESKKTKSRAKRYFALMSLLAIMAISFYAAYKVNQFFEYNKLVFQTPIQSPVLIQKRTIPATATSTEVVITQKELSEKDLILSHANGELLWRVYGLESSFGQKDNCRKSGLYNGFGFKQHTANWVCYKEFAEVVAEADAWFTKQLKTKTVPQALCFYNTGHDLRSCEYYQKYLSIKAN